MAGCACVLSVLGLSILVAALLPPGHEGCQQFDVALHCVNWWLGQVSERCSELVGHPLKTGRIAFIITVIPWLAGGSLKPFCLAAFFTAAISLLYFQASTAL